MNTTLAIDPKLAAATLGQAASVLIWTFLTLFITRIEQFAGTDPQAFAAAVGATGIVIGGLWGWATRNAASPIPGDGANIALSLENNPGVER